MTRTTRGKSIYPIVPPNHHTQIHKSRIPYPEYMSSKILHHRHIRQGVPLHRKKSDSRRIYANRIPIEILSGGNPHMVPNIRISRNRFYPDLPFVQRNQFKFDRKIRTLPDINRFQYLTVRIQELQSRITGSFLQSRNIEYQFVFTNPAPRIDHRNPRFGTFTSQKYRGGASANDRFASRITDKIHDTLDTLLP